MMENGNGFFSRQRRRPPRWWVTAVLMRLWLPVFYKHIPPDWGNMGTFATREAPGGLLKKCVSARGSRRGITRLWNFISLTPCQKEIPVCFYILPLCLPSHLKEIPVRLCSGEKCDELDEQAANVGSPVDCCELRNMFITLCLLGLLGLTLPTPPTPLPQSLAFWGALTQRGGKRKGKKEKFNKSTVTHKRILEALWVNWINGVGPLVQSLVV